VNKFQLDFNSNSPSASQTLNINSFLSYHNYMPTAILLMMLIKKNGAFNLAWENLDFFIKSSVCDNETSRFKREKNEI